MYKGIDVFGIIQSVGVIAALLFSIISIIIGYRDKVEARKPILYLFPKEMEGIFDQEKNIHIYGYGGIKLGLRIINIGGGLAKDINISWLYQGKVVKGETIPYLCERDARLGKKEINLPREYVAMISTLLDVRKNEDAESILDGLDNLMLCITYKDAGTVRYKKNYYVTVIPEPVYCGEEGMMIQRIGLSIQIKDVKGKSNLLFGYFHIHKISTYKLTKNPI